MRSDFSSLNHATRWLWRIVLWTSIAIMFLLLTYSVASAQCVANPTTETAVGLRNSSSQYLTFYIDGERKDAVPPGDRSVDFVVTPGQHALVATAVVDGETVSASRTVDIPDGYVCTWTVTDPERARAIRHKNLKHSPPEQN